MYYKNPTVTKHWNSKEEKYEFKVSMVVDGITSMKKAEDIASQVQDIVTEAEGQETFK